MHRLPRSVALRAPAALCLSHLPALGPPSGARIPTTPQRGAELTLGERTTSAALSDSSPPGQSRLDPSRDATHRGSRTKLRDATRTTGPIRDPSDRG